MKSPARLLCAFCFFGASLACSKTKVTRAPDGILRLECARGMKDCVAQAEKHCAVVDKEGGYEILSGKSKKIMMGAKNGQYRTAAEVAELEVRCGQTPAEEESQSQSVVGTFKLPPRADDEVPPADLPATSAARAPVSSGSVCTKGSTQACIGPGACQGGQVCLPDGSGYGPCDCGSERNTAPPSSSAPSAPHINGQQDPPKAPDFRPGGPAEPLSTP